jgi:arylsulfatase A-like enzyme
MKEPPSKRTEKGFGPHVASGAAAGLGVGLILAYGESVYLLFAVGSFAVNTAFFIKAVCLYGALGALLGFLISTAVFLLRYVRRRPPENASAAYFSIFLGAGLFAESFFYLMDIYPFGGRNKYSMRTLSLDAAAIVVSAAIAIGTYILSKKEFASFRKSKRRRVTWALVAMGFGIVSFVGLDQASGSAEKRAALAKAPVSAEARPNVLFILVDSLRSDRLSGNGYPLPTSPHLDALAAEGVSCKSVLATSTWTVPTHASLFTGLYPSSHGAYSLFSTLEDSVPTLAQILTKNGYSTLCLYNNPLLSPASGLGRGFEESLGIEHDQKTSLTLVRLFKKFLAKATPTEQIMALTRRWAERSRELRRPYFIFMNLFDVRGALLPKEPYFSEFSKSVKKKDLNLSLVRKLSRRLRSRQEKLDILAKLGQEDLRYLAAIYDSLVRYEDEWIGLLIGRLKAAGLLENTLILVTADHGEFLGEHSMLGHLTEKLYDPVLRVPLILWYPEKLSPGVIEDTLSMTDIFPTLLTLIGLKEHIPPGIQGVDFLADKPPAEVLIEFWDDGRKAFVRALYARPWKLIAYPDGKLEIYDLVRDPGEQNDLFTLQPEKARELNDHLQARVQSLKPRPLKVDERKKREMVELLKSLSYIEN